MKTKKIMMILLMTSIFFSQFNYLNGNKQINGQTTTEESTSSTNTSYPDKGSKEKAVTKSMDVTMISTNFLAAGDITDDNEAITVASGQQVLVMAKFSVTSNEIIGQKELGFRVELPEKHGFLAAQSDLYEYILAGPAGPTDTTVVPGKNYLWVILKSEVNSGDTKSFSFYLKPTETGITPNNKKVDIAIQAFEMSTLASVGNVITNSMFFKTTEFSWNPVDATIKSGWDFQSQGQEVIPTMHFVRNVTPKYNYASNGVSFLKEVSYSSTFTVPTGTKNGQEGKPLVLIKPENLTWTNGQALVEGIDYRVDEWTDNTNTYIKSFTTLLKAKNPGQVGAFNLAVEFQIRNATLARQSIIAEYGLTPNATSQEFWLKESGDNNTVEPIVDVETIGTAKQKIGQNRFNQVRFIFKNTLETGEETASKNVFTKKIIKIGGVDTQNTQNDKLAAYPNDVITYQLGKGYKNYQKEALAELTFKEVSGATGYNKEEMMPFRIATGKYSVNSAVPSTTELSITITYIDGTPTFSKVLSGAELSTSTSIDIPAANQANIAEIQYTYRNVEPGFLVETGPILEYRVVPQEDQTTTGTKFTNTAIQSYTYNNPDDNGVAVKKESTSSAFFYYKEKLTDANGRYEETKSAINLSGGKKPVKDEVLIFTIEVKNENATPWNIEKISDEFTHNLSIYDGDKTKDNNLLAPGIDTKFLSENAGNLVVWNPTDLTQPLADENVIKNVISSVPAIGEMGRLEIEFEPGKVVIQPGQTLKVTYTMKANETNIPEQTIGNTYDLIGNGNKILAAGEFWWSPALPGLTDNNRNKSWENVTSLKTTDAPIGEDVIAFTVTVKNDSGKDWENEIQVIDTYDAYLEAYT